MLGFEAFGLNEALIGPGECSRGGILDISCFGGYTESVTKTSVKIAVE